MSYGETVVASGSGLWWVVLNYRLPREPSTPRIAVWRKLKRLGVAQLGDGLVALPADARTQEQLEWVAEEIAEAGGSSNLWQATLMSRAQERALVERMAGARAVEYRSIVERASVAVDLEGRERMAAVRSLRAELRRIQRRDYFPPAERAEARLALQTLATSEGPGAEVGGTEVSS